jgi:methionyl-tRNA formyltransferase
MACGDGKLLRIVELQAPGKKRMRAADYLRGHAIV